MREVISENQENPEKGENSSRTPGSAGFEVLIRRIGEGSEAAVWELLDRYSTNILRVVRRHLPSEIRVKVDSVDIVQSVWKSLLRKGEGFDHIASAEQFVGYIAQVARNKVMETHKHFTQYPKFDIRRERRIDARKEGALPSDDSPEDVVDQKTHDPGAIVQARDNWERVLRGIGDRGERIVELRLQGMTLEEIAEEIGVSTMTVRRTLASVLTSLNV